MTAKIDFLIVSENLPEKARNKLKYSYLGNYISLKDCALEVKNSTILGKQILKDLGFEE